MTKVKYIKVSVSDRLPEKPGTYDSNLGEVFYNKFREHFEHNDKANDLFPNYWFREVPDYEDEMKEVLLQLVGCHTCGHTVPDWLNDKAEDLLTNLKTES
ncbi:hypothetical protein [Chryseobacterium indologenes]|uniref:hypothetical protein n=1 Tax=Chryseobacterium indologenes TaxID=253 RepID=UPI001BCDF8D0|nr:hypothetical protein [Chryseobacterium indologenes]